MIPHLSRRLARAVSLVLALMLVAPAVVVADMTIPDGDGATPVALNTWVIGNVCVGQTVQRTVPIAIQRAYDLGAGPTDPARTFKDGASVTVSVTGTSNAALSGTMGADTNIVLPSNWVSQAIGFIYQDDLASVDVSVTPTVTGASGTQTVNLRASGPNISNTTINTSNQRLQVTWTGITCNTAPSAPGKPAPTPASPNQGGFTLNWTASTDDGQPNPPSAVTYALEGKRLAESFASVASGITTNSYSFTSGNPAEGTWTYRVRASDSALTSAYSADSDPVVVDRTNPTLGTCPAGGPYLLNSGGGSQSVGPIGATDGNLPDGSAGSGVNAGASTLSGTVNTTSVGTKSVSFTAADNAGNSAQKSCSYSVVYGFAGFFSPVDNSPVLNKAKAGQAIPLKWRLTDANGDPVLTLTSVSVTATGLTCSLGTTADAVEEYATGSSGLQNLGDGYYQFNWATPKSYANSCKTAALHLGDGSSRTALFQFTK